MISFILSLLLLFPFQGFRDRPEINAAPLEGKIDSSIEDFSLQGWAGTPAAKKFSTSEPFFSSIGVAFISGQSLTQADEEHSVVIIGGGIGGLTSGVYLGQAGVDTLLLEGKAPGGAIAQSHNVRNWPGEKAIAGGALTDNVRSQATSAGVEIRSEEVISVNFKQRPFLITARDFANQTKTIQAKALIIAMGSLPNRLNVPGEQENWGKGVYSCAVCDGPLYKDKVVAVVGGGESALTETDYLSGLAKKVYILVRKDKWRATLDDYKKQLLAKPNVEVIFSTTITEIKKKEDGSLTLAIDSPKQKELAVDALFLGIGSTPNSKLFKSQLRLDKEGYIVLKEAQATSLPGVFAIGDIVDPHFKQAICAAGDGAKAAFQARDYVAHHGGNAKALPAKTQAVSKAEIKEFRSIQELEAWAKETKQPIILDFYATWCGPCKSFSSTFEKLSQKLSTKYRFGKVNADLAEELFRKYQVTSMPTVIWMDAEGKVVQKSAGLDEISQLVSELEKTP